MAETERNWSEHERQIMNEPTNNQCYELGVNHRNYGWSQRPWGHWSKEQKQFYSAGYNMAEILHG